MNYIVIRVCCFDCLKFLGVYHLRFNSLSELKSYLKELSSDSDDSFIVYDETTCNEIIRYSFYE